MADEHRNEKSLWQSVHGDLTDEQWDLIADIFVPPFAPGKMGRPRKIPFRRIVDAIFYVGATGCQWRALPTSYPHWNTVHRYHRLWSTNGTWEKISHRLREQVRVEAGNEAEPSALIIDARTVRGAATVTGQTRGYDGGKKISGRKAFGLVDTLGLLIAVVVVAANTADNTGGIAATRRARKQTDRLQNVFCDGGFKTTYKTWCNRHHIGVEVINRIAPHEFVPLPKRWIIERSWSWLINNRRLQLDYERDTKVTEGFYWAAQSHYLLRRPAPQTATATRRTN